MIRLLNFLDRQKVGEIILSLMVLVFTLYAFYAVVIFIHEYIGDWYFIASGVSVLILMRMAKNAPLESELWPDKR